MSPLKHYQGPMLPGTEQDQMNILRETLNAELTTMGLTTATPPPEAADKVVDNPSYPMTEPPEERRYQIDTVLTAYPNGTFGVNLRCEGVDTVGNGEHPELAMVIALHQLWSQIDRPRCAHCGQLLPEEATR